MGKAKTFYTGQNAEKIHANQKTKKTPENPTPYPFINHFSRKRYPFHIPSISDKWCPFQIPCLELCIPFDCCKSMYCLFVFFFLHRNQSQKQPVHRRCFIFLFFPTPLHWRSVNLRGLYFITRGRRTLKRKQRVCEQAILKRERFLDFSKRHYSSISPIGPFNRPK